MVNGVDNNQRAVFFGPDGDTRWVLRHLREHMAHYDHHDLDIRNRQGIAELVETVRPDLIVHAAAQPSHDRAADIPFDDFDTNTAGTVNLLEAARRYCPESPFVFMSTNKVYGDAPNAIRLKELETRWEYDDPEYRNGIGENFSIDQSKHSLFGASKLGADIMVQEYGRYFGMPTCCLRAGCLTGPNHSGVMLHGFLNYLVRCNIREKEYTVFGYKGKQVRDNLHATDVARFVSLFYGQPRTGEVYNIGGGKDNSCSILEAFQRVERITGKTQRSRYAETHRPGDHVCYYSDLGKIRSHYPQWEITMPLDAILDDLVRSRQAGTS